MNAKENFLEAVRFGKPEYVPLGNERIWYMVQFEGNLKHENWTDHWGVGWEVGLEGTVPFPKVNPLPDLSHLDDYRFPDSNDLVFSDGMRIELDLVDRRERLIMSCAVVWEAKAGLVKNAPLLLARFPLASHRVRS